MISFYSPKISLFLAKGYDFKEIELIKLTLLRYIAIFNYINSDMMDSGIQELVIENNYFFGK